MQMHDTKVSTRTLSIRYTFTMPTFDFTCTACKSVFEKTLSFGVKTKPACPECGSKKTEKMLSMPGIVFKGSGFYKTDSKSSSIPKQPPAMTDTKPKTEPEKKPDTKPAQTDSGKTPAKP